MKILAVYVFYKIVFDDNLKFRVLMILCEKHEFWFDDDDDIDLICFVTI